jgi:hypothetical protein
VIKTLCAALLAAAICLAPPAAARAAQAPYGSLEAHFRSYFLQRPFEFSGIQNSLAVGGWLGYVSPQWHGLSFGLTGHTSQPLGGLDASQGGGGLLTDDQGGLSVLGQAWLGWQGQGLSLKAGRQIIETPLINSFDVKIIPVTLEALGVTYAHESGLTLSAAHVIGIKSWTDTVFQPMSRAAGVGGEEPVTLAGADWQVTKNLSIQFWEYYCHQFMNMAYAQADYSLTPAPGWDLTLSAQGLYQFDIGDSLGGGFNTGQMGLMGVAGFKGWKLTLGYTATSLNHDIVNPWGSYPGFTSIMEEDRDRAGERSAVLGLAYDFSGVGLAGLSAYTLHTYGATPDSGENASPDQTEHDLTIDYRFQQGALKGLWIRLRAAMVSADQDLGGDNFSDFRVIVNFPLQILK